jgi:hypothetical protein
MTAKAHGSANLVPIDARGVVAARRIGSTVAKRTRVFEPGRTARAGGYRIFGVQPVREERR